MGEALSIAIVIAALAIGIAGPDAARQYPVNSFGITAGQNYFRGEWDNRTIGLNYYGPQIGEGVLVLGVDLMGEGSAYYHVGIHHQFDLGNDWLLGAQYGLGQYDRGWGPDLGRGAATVFYAQIGAGYALDDTTAIWAWATHHSNAFQGRSNPGIEGFRIEVVMGF